MPRVQFRQWCPPESPLRIEIAEDLLRNLSAKPDALETLGVLYGQRQGDKIRLVSPELRPGLSLLGVSVCRERGEVFLTEFNLEAMEKHLVPLALVIAGNSAGFFVHAADGTMQTVRSYAEFLIAAPAPTPIPKTPSRNWNWAVAGWMALVALPMVALAYLRPTFPQKPITPVLDAREADGQLLIHWEAGSQAILEIQDGMDHSAIPIPANESRATYQPRSREIDISLTRLGGRSLRRESTRFRRAEPPPSERDRLYSELVHIRARADELRRKAAAHRARIASLERAVARACCVETPLDASAGNEERRLKVDAAR